MPINPFNNVNLEVLQSYIYVGPMLLHMDEKSEKTAQSQDTLSERDLEISGFFNFSVQGRDIDSQIKKPP